MFDDSKNVKEPAELILSEIDCMDGEERSYKKIGVVVQERDEQFWLKKFRRALRDGDQDTQRRLQQKFSTLVIDLIHNHPLATMAFDLQNQEYYVTETFRCFWNSAPRHQIYNLKSLSDVLLYLSMIVNAVILDSLRSFSSLKAIPSTSNQLMEVVLTRDYVQNLELWECIESEFSNFRARKIAFLLFHCALRPDEIIVRFPNEFSDADEISQIRRNVMNLLLDLDLISVALNEIS